MTTTTAAPAAPARTLWVDLPTVGWCFGIDVSADGIVVGGAEVADDLFGLTEADAIAVLTSRDPRRFTILSILPAAA